MDLHRDLDRSPDPSRPAAASPPARGGAAAFAALALLLPLGLLLPGAAGAGGKRTTGVDHEPPGHRLYASPQSNPIVASPDGSRVFVASTTSNRVDVIDTATNSRILHIPVGIDPVGLAVKPDGSELWVANHVSDSVSVIDLAPGSPTENFVVQTVQDLPTSSGVTAFDEPVAIAFREDGSKAYVTLSSRNDVAVVDTATYAVTGRLHITAQDPRALAVRGGRLYVAAFESSNQSEVSWCESLSDDAGADQCTLEDVDFGTFAGNPNMPGESKNIVIDPDAPDRDLFVFDTATDTLVEAVSGVGTLLYGLAVSGTGEVYVAQTDARNAVNGRDANSSAPSDVNGDGVVDLADLGNRMFLNQITRVDCGGGSCASPVRFDLEPLPPTDPAPGSALATPYGIALTADDALLVMTAAASSRVASVDPATGAVLDRVDVGAIPRGLAPLDDGDGTHTAYVLNTLGNSVSVVDVDGASGALAGGATIAVGDDPTPDPVRLGRIAFNDASASDSGTFACASCHPDGNTDQVLWRIGGECFLDGCEPGEHEARSTMPIRGLRDTLPLHWDGTLGDPFGGPNGAVGTGGSEPPNCDPADPSTCFRQLVDASQAGVMCDQEGGCAPGSSGLPGLLTDAERDDMALFLENVAYPPARSRPADDQITTAARNGFRDFFTDVGDGIGFADINDPSTCADSDAGCHELPLGTATNSETLAGFEAPTMRGMTDRFLQFSIGPTNAEELLLGSNDGFQVSLMGFTFNTIENPFGDWSPALGYEEEFTFGVAFGLFDLVYAGSGPDVFQMFEEASTGHSGALGRQATINATTAAGCPSCDLEALLDRLELADTRSLVNLRGWAVFFDRFREVSYLAGEGVYAVGDEKLPRAQLIADAQSGDLVATLTGQPREVVSALAPQPLIAPEGASCGTGDGTTGDPSLPTTTTFTVEARHVDDLDFVFVDGQPVSQATLLSGTPTCSTSDGQQPVGDVLVEIDVSGASLGSGIHLVQVRNDAGLLSNELPIVLP